MYIVVNYAVDHTFYGFIGVIITAGCLENTRKVGWIYNLFECSPMEFPEKEWFLMQ